jgi:hypothetical protein
MTVVGPVPRWSRFLPFTAASYLHWLIASSWRKRTAATLYPDQATDLVRRASTGESKAQLARDFEISRETVYQYIRAAQGNG